MGSIAQLLPENSPVVEAIYAYHKERGDAEPIRGYLGASIIGHPCERFLWFTFRSCIRPEFTGRMYRLFETGDLEEGRFVKELRAIGCTVHDVDPNTGKQFEVSAFGGHFSGHMDGCAVGIPKAEKTWAVLEFKTHNAKSFAKLEKEGVQASKPQHYAQMQIYMHLTKMTRALYLARNKDTDHLYAERVRYDKQFSEGLMEKARRIITASEPPIRSMTRPDWYECKWCDAHKICWGCEKVLPLPVISCKQCCHATPNVEDGSWKCEEDKPFGEPCMGHLPLPGLFPFAKPVDYSGGMTFYKTDDGKTFEIGGFGYSTKELLELEREQL